MATYLDLLNKFWKINEDEQFSASEICLYTFLLHIWNKKGRPDVFEYATIKIAAEIGMDKKTLVRARLGLQEKGVLIFRDGDRRKSKPLYCVSLIAEAYDDSFWGNYSTKKETKKETKNETKESFGGNFGSTFGGIIPPKMPPVYNKSNKSIRDKEILELSADNSLSNSDELDLQAENPPMAENPKGGENPDAPIAPHIEEPQHPADEIPIAPPPPNEDAKNVAKAVALWHELCPSLGRVLKVSDTRKRKVLVRLKEMESVTEDKDPFPILREVFAKCQQSKFLLGDNNRGWRVDFDWIFTNSQNWVKIYEGKYDNRTNTQTTNGTEETAYNDPRRGIDAGHKKQKNWGASL